MSTSAPQPPSTSGGASAASPTTPPPPPKASDLIPEIKALYDKVAAINQATQAAGQSTNHSLPALQALSQAHDRLLLHSVWVEQYGGK